MGVNDNAALGGLAEHFGQARADEPIIARLKRSGIESGNSFDIDKLDPSVREALASVPKDAQKLTAGLPHTKCLMLFDTGPPVPALKLERDNHGAFPTPAIIDKCRAITEPSMKVPKPDLRHLNMVAPFEASEPAAGRSYVSPRGCSIPERWNEGRLHRRRRPSKSSGYYPKQNPRSRRTRSDADAKSSRPIAVGLPHHDDAPVLQAWRGGQRVRRQLTTVKSYSCAEPGLGWSFELRVHADPVQILGGGIDLVRENAMRERDEFSNEFVTPSGISRQHNLLSQDRIDVSAKPRGLRALGGHLVNEPLILGLHHRNQRRPVARPLNENRAWPISFEIAKAAVSQLIKVALLTPLVDEIMFAADRAPELNGTKAVP